MRYLLLLALLWLSAAPAALAQTPPQQASSYRYWDANYDSLQAVLAGQRADTARLRTLLHLADLGAVGESEFANREAPLAELVALTTRMRRPEQRAYGLALAGFRLAEANAPAPALDSLQRAIAELETLRRPVHAFLITVRQLYSRLNQQQEKRAFYAGKLALYQQRGAPPIDIATCYHGLGGFYAQRGDYNQALGYYLRAAEGFRGNSSFWYHNELGVIGEYYAEWGNEARGLPYLQQALAWQAAHKLSSANFIRDLTKIYLHQGRYPLALAYANRSLVPSFAGNRVSALQEAYGLVIKSQVLLALGRPAEVGPLLQRAQLLGDSLRLLFTANYGAFELDATWAGYYAAQGDARRAEAAWLGAHRKAQLAGATPRRLAYLRELGRFYQQQGRSQPAARYALAAAGLADTLERAQGALHVAEYEVQQADRAQQARITALRAGQLQDAAQARRQRRVLWAVLGGAALLVVFGGVLLRGNRQQQRANVLLSQQKAEIQAQRDQTTHALTELRTTQAQLIQKEKMASLGELTAGIAHEIQNPLNFVNNFSEVSSELLTELADEQARPVRDAVLEAELVGDLRQNLGKITLHGRRAAGIVKGMLEHSSSRAGEREPTDLNRLCDEYLRLAYQGLRAKDKSFNAMLATDFAPDLPLVEGVAGDLGRVLLNLLSNAFYAVQQRQQTGEPGYAPQVGVSTQRVNGHVEILVRDNGAGMPAEVQQKIFQPFFTTKPTGEGTGLGLSLSHDIIAQGHGGTLAVESEHGQGTTFTICLPH